MKTGKTLASVTVLLGLMVSPALAGKKHRKHAAPSTSRRVAPASSSTREYTEHKEEISFDAPINQEKADRLKTIRTRRGTPAADDNEFDKGWKAKLREAAANVRIGESVHVEHEYSRYN